MPHGFSKVHLSAYIIRNKNTVMVQQCKFRSALHEQLPNNCNKNGDPATNSACFSMFIIFQLFFNIFQLFFNVFQAIFRTSRALPASRRTLASNMVCNSGSCSSDFTLSWQVDHPNRSGTPWYTQEKSQFHKPQVLGDDGWFVIFMIGFRTCHPFKWLHSKPVQLRFLGTGPLTCVIGNQAPKISIADETVGFRNVEKGFYT